MIPTIVNQLIKNYIDLLSEKLQNNIEGIYLHGSIALNAFDDSSDIDFLTVVNRPLKNKDIQILEQIHQIIALKYKKPEMDGMYVQRSELGKSEGMKSIPFYNSGVMHASGDFNQNPITWWTLKHYGIRITGPEIDEFRLDVNPKDLINYVHANMNSYWKKRVQMFRNLDYSTIPDALIEQEIEWSVLGVSRQFYTIKEHDITSKLGAGVYALKHLPNEWSNIIQEAIRIREKSEVSTYHTNEERVSDALNFLSFLIDHCNDLVEGR